VDAYHHTKESILELIASRLQLSAKHYYLKMGLELLGPMVYKPKQ